MTDPVPTRMRAMGIERFGGADEFKLMDLAVPIPKPDELLVRIIATSVNPVDYKMRRNGYDAPHRFPVVLGRDVAGYVAGAGAWVKGFRAGDPVFAFGRQKDFSRGTYAEYVAMPAGWFAPIPAGLAIDMAAAMPLVTLTAYQALRALVLVEGETILIHGGAGAVGSRAVQLAKSIGARVIATAGADAADRCRADGAEIVIDYKTQDFVAVSRGTCPDGVDAVLDTIGGDTLMRSADALRDGGRLVTLLAPPPTEPFKSRGIRAERYQTQGSGGDLALMGGLVADGRLKVRIADELPLEQVADAHRQLEAGKVRGKLVLRVARD